MQIICRLLFRGTEFTSVLHCKSGGNALKYCSRGA